MQLTKKEECPSQKQTVRRAPPKNNRFVGPLWCTPFKRDSKPKRVCRQGLLPSRANSILWHLWIKTPLWIDSRVCQIAKFQWMSQSVWPSGVDDDSFIPFSNHNNVKKIICGSMVEDRNRWQFHTLTSKPLCGSWCLFFFWLRGSETYGCWLANLYSRR